MIDRLNLEKTHVILIGFRDHLLEFGEVRVLEFLWRTIDLQPAASHRGRTLHRIDMAGPPFAEETRPLVGGVVRENQGNFQESGMVVERVRVSFIQACEPDRIKLGESQDASFD